MAQPKLVNHLENESVTKKNLSKPVKIFLAVFAVFFFLVLMFFIGNYLYCNAFAFCDPVRLTMSPEMRLTQTTNQYELAIQDISMGRYKIAKQRIEYVIKQNPEYPGATEKLRDLQRILDATPPAP